MVHALLLTLDDRYGLVVDVLLDQRQNLLLLLVDLLHLRGNDALLLGPVEGDVDKLLPPFRSDLDNDVLLQELLLSALLDVLVDLDDFLLASAILLQSKNGHDFLVLNPLEPLHFDMLGLDGDADPELRNGLLGVLLPVDYPLASRQKHRLVLQQFLLQIFLIFIVNDAGRTDDVGATLHVALVVGPEVVGVGIGQFALGADEGPIVRFHGVLLVLAETGLLSRYLLRLLVLDDVVVFVRPGVQTHPNRTQLGDRPEDGPAQLIDVVVPGIGAGDEVGLSRFDCQLNLAHKGIFVEYVDEDIVGTQFQSVLYPDNLQCLRIGFAHPLKFLVDMQNLSLLRTALASHEITHLESEKVGRSIPPGFGRQLLLVQFFRHSEQSMDESVEVDDDVTVKIVDSFCCKFTTNFLYFINVEKAILLNQFLLEKLGLLVEVIREKFVHKLVDLLFLVFDHVVERLFHPHKHSVSVTSLLLHAKVFLPVQKEILGLEFLPQLLAPLGQNPENGWALDEKMSFLDLVLTVGGDIFGYFPPDDVVRVILDLLSILLVGNLITNHHSLEILSRRFNFRLLYPAAIIDVLDNGLPSLIHPTLTINLLECFGHGVKKLLVNCLG